MSGTKKKALCGVIFIALVLLLLRNVHQLPERNDDTGIEIERVPFVTEREAEASYYKIKSQPPPRMHLVGSAELLGFPKDVIEKNIERQIKLDLDEWGGGAENRNRKVAQWLDIIREVMAFPLERGRESYRIQYGVTTIGENFCNSSMLIGVRVRDFLQGQRQGQTSVDAKVRVLPDTLDEDARIEKSLAVPVWVNPDLDLRSVQKIEIDRHVCIDHISRSSRVWFDFHPSFTTCRDFAYLFPWAFAHASPTVLDRSIDIGGSQKWWVYTIEGFFEEPDGHPSQYHLVFTIRYRSYPDAVLGEQPSEGEFSIRTPAPLNSHHSLINHRAAQLIQTLYSRFAADGDCN